MLARLRDLLASAAMAAALAAAPAIAQQQPAQPPAAQPPAKAEDAQPPAKAEAEMVGLPVFSSDGQKLGQVTHVGTLAGQPTLRAELGDFLGGGSRPVLIPATMFAHKTDRIEVAMTAAEVKDTVEKQQSSQ
jgi:hypothetical protein